jgi:hypothetical protein
MVTVRLPDQPNLGAARLGQGEIENEFSTVDCIIG